MALSELQIQLFEDLKRRGSKSQVILQSSKAV